MIIRIMVFVWSMLAIVLHLCGVGSFADWSITAFPWRWSCLFILYWWLILVTIIVKLQTILLYKRQKEWDDSPEWVKRFTERPQ